MLRTTYLLQTRGDRTGRRGSRSLSMRRVLMTQTSSEYCEGYKVTEYSEGVQSNREFDEGAQTNKTFFKLSVLGIVRPASFFDKSLY